MNKKENCLISEDVLKEKYFVENKPMHKIADELCVSVGSVYRYFRIYGIETRNQKETFTFKGRHHTDEERKLIGDMKRGQKLSQETKKKISEAHKKSGIGHKKKRPDGYVAIYFPDHPNSTKNGYIMEHDLIMECLIGRHLKNDEVVHHINHIRDDNRKENLQLMTLKEHASLHMKERYDKRRNNL